MNALTLFPEVPMPTKKPSPWGYQVAVRFTREDLKKLDQLVAGAPRHASPTGFWLAPSRSSVLVDLVRGADKPSTKQLELTDPRQVSLDEAIADAKKKAPHGAPQKPRAAKAVTPRRKKQIAAAKKRFAEKNRRGRR